MAYKVHKIDEMEIWRNYIEEFLVTNLCNVDKQREVLDIGVGDSTNTIRRYFPYMKTLDQRNDVGADIQVDLCDAGGIYPYKDKFDIVFMMEVLEHTKQPWIVADHVTHLVKPGELSLIFISVPSFLHWHPMGEVCGDYWRFLPGHVPNLFPNCEILEERVCQPDKTKPLGMCYTLRRP